MILNDNELVASLWGVTALFAAATVWLFKWTDRRRTLADLAARPCPRCRRAYGREILSELKMVRYEWTFMRGSSRATLGVPRATFLVSCPHCDSENEFNEQGRIFFHPQIGILNFTREVMPQPAVKSIINLGPTAHANH